MLDKLKITTRINSIKNMKSIVRQKINFLQSATEYQTKKSTYILKEILEKIKNYDGLLFYSFLLCQQVAPGGSIWSNFI